MDIKSPLPFETSDKAHANLFNQMVDTLVENDNVLSKQIAGITNESLFKLTADQAIQDASASGEEYPIGITFMDIGQANDTGYPTRYGFVKNIVTFDLFNITMGLETNQAVILIAQVRGVVTGGRDLAGPSGTKYLDSFMPVLVQLGSSY